MPLEKEDKEILLSQSNSKTSAEWVSYFNEKYTKKQIWDFYYHNNVKCKNSKIGNQNGRKYNINQDYFKTWSHNMAYILGFWFADGCIYGGKIFDITQSKKDKYILKQIAKELHYEGKLYDNVDKQASRINFSCKVIYDDIVALGGKENKSYNIHFPKVPEKYLSDFIRGYFDGDGCVMLLKGKRLNTAFTSASWDFLNELWNKLKKYAKVQGGSYDKSCMSIKFGKRDSLLIGKYMYKNNPELFLKRKRDKFKAIGEL